MGKITILDVAQSAGVSVATVDRVLNHRTGVRKVTVERVEAAIRQLNYQPDRLAARLARSRDYRFCFVLPTGNNTFMVQLGEEVRAAAERMAPERVVIDMRLTDVFDGNVLAQTLDQIGDIYDGVAVVALDHPSVREAISGLSQRGVTVVTLVSDVPGSKRAMTEPGIVFESEFAVTGGGLHLIYSTIARLGGRPAKLATPEQVLQAALASSDADAMKALDHFVIWLARLAGDAAMMMQAQGGVYLAGGIAPSIVKKLQEGPFRRIFEEKGRLDLNAVPVYVIMDDFPAFKGCAAALNR